MKVKVNQDLKNQNYSVTVEITELTSADKELFSDYGQQIVNVAGKITKKVIETVTTQVPVLDTNGDPVLDGSGNPTFTTETKPVEKEVALLNEGDKFKYLLADFETPMVRIFPTCTYGEEAQEIAETWGLTVKNRIEEIVDKLRTNPDTFSGEREYLI